MLLHVYHAKLPNWGYPSLDRPDPVWPDDFEHVADVTINSHKSIEDALDSAFALTNHVWCDWHNPPDPGVVCFVKSPRSTSVGDMIVVNRRRYLCIDAGWKRISPANLQNFTQKK